MPQWDYKRVRLDAADVSKPTFEERLTQLGSEGWELVAAIQHEKHGYSQDVDFVFKRPAPWGGR